VAGDDYREASQSQWGDAAGAWAELADRPEEGAQAAAAAWILENADLRPGDEVLELAGGTGQVGFQAARLVGPEGRVVCSDFAEPMAQAAAERAKRQGLANVEARVLDAERLALREGEAFDAVICRFGYMLMADPLQALRESLRALRPGGRLALAVWGRAERNPALNLILDAMMAELDAPPPEPGTPGPFALDDPARVAALLEQAGFADVHAELLESERRNDSLEAWWEHMLKVAGPVIAILEALPDERVEAIRGRAFASAAQYARDGRGVRFPAELCVARARRP
jgi:SAM-dependent methyltransferase